MAYTRPWNEVFALPGTRDADEIDDSDREHHVDLTERFSDILKDVNADPWELQSQGSGLVTRYPWAFGTPGVPSSGPLGVGNAVSPQNSGASVVIYMPILVPIGTKLVGANFRMQVTGVGASGTATVFKTTAGGSVFAIGAPAVAGALVSDVGIGIVDDTANPGDSYIAQVNLANGTGTFAKFWDVEVVLESA